MAAIELLEQLRGCGVSVTVEFNELVLRPGSRIPSDLLHEVRQHKQELIEELQPVYGDGQQPPLDRSLETGLELRRWYDHTRDPQNFDKWLDWAMTTFDPSEDSQQCP